MAYRDEFKHFKKLLNKVAVKGIVLENKIYNLYAETKTVADQLEKVSFLSATQKQFLRDELQNLIKSSQDAYGNIPGDRARNLSRLLGDE